MNIFGTSFDYQARLAKVRRAMVVEGLDCIVVHNWTNQYYLSGLYQHLPWYPVSHTHITESPLLIFREHDPVFLCAFITLHAVREGTWVSDIRAIDQGFARNAYEGVAKVLEEKGLSAGRIGIEEKCCTASTYQNLVKVLPAATIVWSGDILYSTRSVKEPAEVALIRKAVEIAQSALKVAMEVAKPGVTEMEVQLAVEIEMKRLGAFREVETMCQSGIRTANYRAFAADWKRIEDGDPLLIDVGGLYKGYGCDIARTWVVGEPTAEHKKIARDLYAVFDAFCAYIKPGKTFAEVFDYIRGEMSGMGYPATKTEFPCQQFAIHGVGLGPFHDYPHPTHRETVFEPGMVISFQPSVRRREFTIRFEDNFLITSDGIELLSTFPRQLI